MNVQSAFEGTEQTCFIPWSNFHEEEKSGEWSEAFQCSSQPSIDMTTVNTLRCDMAREERVGIDRHVMHWHFRC
jgi:hypothetical protein